MELDESKFKSKTGQRLYYLLFKGGREIEQEWQDGLRKGPRQIAQQPEEPSQETYGKSYSVTQETPKQKESKPKKKSKKKKKETEKQPEQPKEELSDVVNSIDVQPESQQSDKKSWQQQLNYSTPSLHVPLQVYKDLGVVGEELNMLKSLSNICTSKSTLYEGPSNAGKSFIMNNAFELVPDHMKMKIADSKYFFDLAKQAGGKLPFVIIEELQTFLRNSKNEKDALRFLMNEETYSYPAGDGSVLPISARAVFASIADTNAYKKRIVNKDKELLRRLHRVRVELTDEKIQERLEALANQQMPSFNSESNDDVSLDVLKYHVEQTINLDIPQNKFFNPFARFMVSYIMDVCKGNGSVEQSAEKAKQNKNYMLFGTKWNAKQRKMEKGSNFKYIAGIQDAYNAKMLTDSDIGKKTNNFDWRACWESGLESLRVSGYPVEIIAAYQSRQVKDDKLYVTDPVTDQHVLLADLSKPAPAYLVVTREDSGNSFDEPEKSSIDEKVNAAPGFQGEEQSSDEYNPMFPVPVTAGQPVAGEIIDADYEVIDSKKTQEEKVNLPVPVNRRYDAVPKNGNNKGSNNGLPLKERKYLTCGKGD